MLHSLPKKQNGAFRDSGLHQQGSSIALVGGLCFEVLGCEAIPHKLSLTCSLRQNMTDYLVMLLDSLIFIKMIEVCNSDISLVCVFCSFEKAAAVCGAD